MSRAWRFVFIVFPLTLALLFCGNLAVYGQLIAEEYGFVAVTFRSDLKVLGDPAYFEGPPANLPPFEEKFRAYENDYYTWAELANKQSCWIRVVVENLSDTTVKAPVKFQAHPGYIDVFFKNPEGNWMKKSIGRLAGKKDAINSFYPAILREFPPGVDTMYFYNHEPSNRFSLNSVRITDDSDIQYDRADFYVTHEGFAFLLISFCFFLAFQLCYVFIQGYFHSGAVYREYIFYIISILIYFTVRIEVLMDLNLITSSIPGVRRILNDILLYLPFAFYLRFSRYFIGLQDIRTQQNRYMIYAERIIYVIAFFHIVLYNSGFINLSATISLITFVPLSIFSLYLIFFFFRITNGQIRFLLLGSLCITAGHAIAMSYSFAPDILKPFMLFGQPLSLTIIGMLLEMFFFNTGLGFKAKYEQEGKIQAQEQLIGQMKENDRMQRRMQSMRNKIASDLHDDVGSTLSSIGLYSEVGAKQVEQNPEVVKGILEKIASSSQRMMTAMNDIVWAIQSFGDQGESIRERLERTARERLNPAGIDFEMNCDQRLDQLSFTIEARRNILLLFKEIINNAAKYSMAGKVIAEARFDNNDLILIISDNGKGFNPANRKPGNGIITMKNRAEELGGSIELNSSEGHGTRITITIPVAEVSMNSINHKHP